MLEIGTVIGGKYKIQSVLGRGGMSVVYLAVNEKANKPWAVKELVRKEFQELETERKEIALMKRLKNPHLPSIVDVIEQGERLLIVMDYVEGQTLEAMLREQGGPAGGTGTGLGRTALSGTDLSAQTVAACHIPGYEAFQRNA